MGALSPDEHVDHKTPIKSGGGNAPTNLKVSDGSSNSAHGGKIGNKAGKAAGARIGHKSRKLKKKVKGSKKMKPTSGVCKKCKKAKNKCHCN